MGSVLVVSPHRDDAAFSCAIAIRWFASTNRVIIANCFTVSQYAPYRTEESGTVTELRREEDCAFAYVSGATLDDLSLIDAPERLEISVSGISTRRALTDVDSGPRSEIENHIRSIGADLVLAPLTIGDHIDHRIARAAAQDAAGPCIGFYEDLPYAARNPEDRLRELTALNGVELHPWLFNSENGYAWKYSCASIYRSQISNETAEEIALYGARYENGERYWMTSEALQFVRSL